MPLDVFLLTHLFVQFVFPLPAVLLVRPLSTLTNHNQNITIAFIPIIASTTTGPRGENIN